MSNPNSLATVLIGTGLESSLFEAISTAVIPIICKSSDDKRSFCWKKAGKTWSIMWTARHKAFTDHWKVWYTFMSHLMSLNLFPTILGYYWVHFSIKSLSFASPFESFVRLESFPPTNKTFWIAACSRVRCSSCP